MVAVWGSPECGVSIGEILARNELGAVGENDVVCCEAFFGGGRGGNNDDKAGAESESEDWAIFLGESVECSVDWVFEEMKMAKDWER